MKKQLSKEKLIQAHQIMQRNNEMLKQQEEALLYNIQIKQNQSFNIQSAAISNYRRQVSPNQQYDYLKNQNKKQNILKPSRSPSPVIDPRGQRNLRSDSRGKSQNREKSQDQSYIQQKPRYIQYTTSKTLTDIKPKDIDKFKYQKSKTNQYIYKENEENVDDCDLEEGNANFPQSSCQLIPEFNVVQITQKRTRKRSYDQDENSNHDEGYFSVQRDLQLSNNKLYSKKREMKDIQNESMKTYYHITGQSFKWSSKLKNVSQTQRKGALQNYCQNKLQYEQSKQQQYQNGCSLMDNNHIQENQNIQRSTSLQDNLDKQNFMLSFNPLMAADTFSQLTDHYINLSKQQIENPNHHQNFKLFNKLDQGSFGQVDLYFLDIEDSSKKNQSQTEVSNNTVKSSLQYIKNESHFGLSINNIDSSQLEYKRSSLYFQKTQNEIIDFDKGIIKQPINGVKLQQSSQGASQDSTKINSLNDQSNHKYSTTQNNSLSTISKNQLYQNNANPEYINPTYVINQFQNKAILPVAGKKIKILDEFIRELFIMQTIECDNIPKLLGQDINQQILFIELGLCSLHDLKMDSQQHNYKLSDQLTYSILINIIQAIESLLSNYDAKQQKSQPLFHSDIKPQNIILTIQKTKESQQPQIKLFLIDFGGASFELEDYWTYFTPAFVCPNLWERLANTKFKQDFLTWPEVRYAEVYAACRSIQFLIVEDKYKDLFKKENSLQFIRQYEKSYPKTCKILDKVFNYISDYKIFSDYKNVFPNQEPSINNYKINFDEEQLFSISKFYKIIQNELQVRNSIYQQ